MIIPLKAVTDYTTFCLSQFTISDYAMKVFSCLDQQTGNTSRVIHWSYAVDMTSSAVMRPCVSSLVIGEAGPRVSILATAAEALFMMLALL